MNTKEIKRNNTFRNFFPYLILLVIIGATLFILNMGNNTVHELKTGELIQALKNEEVTEIVITPKSNESIYVVEGKLKDYKDNESFSVKVIEAEIGDITTYAAEKDIKEYETNSDPGSSPVLYIIVQVLPLVLLAVMAYVLFSKLANSNKGSMDFGKSRAKLSDDKHQAKFSDKRRG